MARPEAGRDAGRFAGLAKSGRRYDADRVCVESRKQGYLVCMALSEVMPEDDLRTFTVADCEFLAGFATGPNWKTVQPAQRLYYQGLRARLRSLSLYVASTARTGIPLSRKESAQAPSGRAAGDMWCCVSLQLPGTLRSRCRLR